jgi:hypothetical protein
MAMRQEEVDAEKQVGAVKFEAADVATCSG